MLSDRFRWGKAALLTALLAALCVANFITAPELLRTDARAYVRHPGSQQEPARFGFTRVLEAREDGSARVRIWDTEVEVRQGAVGWKAGDLVSLSGWMTPDGRIDIDSFTLHRARWLKKLVSLLAAVIFLGILGRRAVRGVSRREGACRT